MPRFFFHVHDDVDTEDNEGVELRNIQAATDDAIHSARGLMCETLMKGHISLTHRIDVEDGEGRVLNSIRFADVVKIHS